MNRRRLAAVLLAAAATAGCFGQVLQSGNEAPARSRLDPSAAQPAGALVPHSISVARPRAPMSLDTDRIAVATPGHGFDHLAGARWSDPAPQLLQSLLVAALSGDAHFAAAVAAPSRVSTDYSIDVGLTAFEARYADTDAAPTVVVAFTVNLLEGPGGRRIATLPVEATAVAARNDRGAVVAAFEQAANEAARTAALGVAAAVPRG